MTVWLIDKSALVRLGQSPQASDWALRIQRGLVVRVSKVTRLEIGFSARSAAELRSSQARPPLAASGPVTWVKCNVSVHEDGQTLVRVDPAGELRNMFSASKPIRASGTISMTTRPGVSRWATNAACCVSLFGRTLAASSG